MGARERPSGLRRIGGEALKRTALKRGTRLRPIGKRGAKARKELDLVRLEVLVRARGRCERCKKASRVLDLHHRRGRAQGGSHTVQNLVALCRACHTGITDHTASDWRDWIVTRKAVRS